MLSSIHPLGERAKGNRYWLTATGFVVGATAGGAALGLVVGLVGYAIEAAIGPAASAMTATVVAVAALGAVAEAAGRRLPSLRRQVNESWLRTYRGWVYGAAFGFQLGAGVLTYITSAAVYVVVVAALLVAHLGAAITIGSVFGLGRGLSILLGRHITSTNELVGFHRRLARTAPRVQGASVAALGAAALLAGLTLL